MMDGDDRLQALDPYVPAAWAAVRFVVGVEWLRASWHKLGDAGWTEAPRGAAIEGYRRGAIAKPTKMSRSRWTPDEGDRRPWSLNESRVLVLGIRGHQSPDDPLQLAIILFGGRAGTIGLDRWVVPELRRIAGDRLNQVWDVGVVILGVVALAFLARIATNTGGWETSLVAIAIAAVIAAATWWTRSRPAASA
jgi:hypothetical protein